MITDPDTDLGSLLGVWAHPDDEAYLSAGLMALAADAGRRVTCLTATRGEAGFPEDDSRTIEELTALRVAELDACLAILGVREHLFLDYPDGGCADVDDHEAAARIAQVIDEVHPDTVLTFGPDGATGHPDHIAACRWATLAVGRATVRTRLLYATKGVGWAERFFADAPTDVLMVEGLQPEAVPESELAVHLTCTGELLDRKLAALRAQASQVEPWREAVGADIFRELVSEEFFREPRATDRAVTLPGARR